MRVSDEQVERSLAALRTVRRDSGAADADRARQREAVRDLLQQVLSSPTVRAEAIERGRSRLDRLATGEEPTSDEVAAKLVGRLVCDRLR